MKMNLTLLAAALSLGCAGVFAQTAIANTTQRDVAQQNRIEHGLQDGSLSTHEAAQLEKDQSRIDHLQARDLRDGQVSPAERAQLDAAQNKASADIAADRHNAVTGQPGSASSRRMQADVARNLHQDQRIQSGVQSGALNAHETARLERGQARVDRQEARAAANGHVGRAEQRAIQRSEDRQSARIYRQKHDAQVQG